MATTYRKRYNLVRTTLGAALTTGSTSITFATALKEGGPSGTNIATLGTDEYLTLTIDDEIVYLTAYTSGATSGTIVRGQEGTADPGSSHANGTVVKHAPTKADAGPVSAAATLTDKTPNSTSFQLYGAALVIAQALLPPSIVVMATAITRMSPGPGSVAVGDRGQIKLQASFDGGSSFADIGVTQTPALLSATAARATPVTVPARGEGTLTGDLQVKVLVLDLDQANDTSWVSGYLTVLAHAR